MMRHTRAVLAMAAALLAAAPVAAAEQPAPEHECDRLAQPPRQTMGKLPVFAEGVGYATLRGPAARTACTRAMAENPDELRFVVYAARAADKAGDPREAVRLYRQAADRGNPLAQNNLGAMYEAGEGMLPRNDREAERLYPPLRRTELPGRPVQPRHPLRHRPRRPAPQRPRSRQAMAARRRAGRHPGPEQPRPHVRRRPRRPPTRRQGGRPHVAHGRRSRQHRSPQQPPPPRRRKLNAIPQHSPPDE